VNPTAPKVDAQKFIKEWQRGVPVKDIAAAFKIDPVRVRAIAHVLRSHGVNLELRKPGRPPNELDTKGRSYEDLAKMTR
jgi:hypothetical protein